MNDEINYKTNPLHGVSLKTLLTEIVDHYGFEILYAYLNINCFNMNPSIESSIKFLKKTTWAREKVEAFYMYQFKNLPRSSAEQALLPPRDRVIPEGQMPGEPKELSLEDAPPRREKLANKQNQPGRGERDRLDKRNNANDRDNTPSWKSGRKSSNSPNSASKGKANPWANAKPKSR
jgi:uncharacterized protein (DUF2132 family)